MKVMNMIAKLIHALYRRAGGDGIKSAGQKAWEGSVRAQS